MILENIPAHIAENKVLFISGIDTNVGKTYATAALACTFIKAGYKTITQKLIQTGCKTSSEDIEKHRELMGIELLDIDKKGITCPVILSYPASPHLAAQIDNTTIEISKIYNATKELTSCYDIVLLEGAGGIMVPINSDNNANNSLGGYLTIDYIKDHNYPVVLVTSGKLGSLNHTLLSIDACHNRGIEIKMIIYNMYPNEDDIITKSSLEYLNSLGIPVVVLNYIK